MPRGRHRHSPPLHRLLPPSAIAGVSVVCALGPWAFSEAMVLRALAAAAAVTAVTGAVVMRRWDTHAGKQVADLVRARASDEWRYEERVAELETDLEESRELRAKLEQRLRARRAELAGLRNEHAALLRRYATAETERASALEGRRLLEIEAAVPSPSSSPALPPARSAERDAVGGTGEETGTPEGAENSEGAQGSDDADDFEDGDGSEVSGMSWTSRMNGDEGKPYAVFSPEGARLYQRALTALVRFDGDAPAASAVGDVPAARGSSETRAAGQGGAGSEAPGPEAAEASGPEAAEPDASESDGAVPDAPGAVAPAAEASHGEVAGAEPVAKGERAAEAVKGGSGASPSEPASKSSAEKGEEAEGPEGVERLPRAEEAGERESGEERERPEASGVHARAGAGPTAPAEPAHPAGRRPAGHFTVPTAVAVVPAAPVRRPVVEGGFDFFGTQKGAPKAALDAVQNEDLADVVGQEALAVHKAEAEGEFKPADARSRGVGQVIDLTAHDETQHIDIQGLRSAAS
ncbi:hypothetical protein [Streptomyces sp. NPDC096012]|uniref:hypothetical protein n=1 Tax=Streptomyces sp. NPDC096012 TaxID=3155684 RepID=UPI00336A578D